MSIQIYSLPSVPEGFLVKKKPPEFLVLVAMFSIQDHTDGCLSRNSRSFFSSANDSAKVT